MNWQSFKLNSVPLFSNPKNNSPQSLRTVHCTLPYWCIRDLTKLWRWRKRGRPKSNSARASRFLLVYFRTETARGLILQSLSELGRGPSLQLQPKFPSFKATGRLVIVWKDAKSIFSVTFSWTSPLSDRKVPIKTMLAFRANPVGVELFSYVNTFCCSIKFAYLLTTWVKTLYTRIFVEWNSKK